MRCGENLEKNQVSEFQGFRVSRFKVSMFQSFNVSKTASCGLLLEWNAPHFTNAPPGPPLAVS
jgi:hypothetical protein